MPEREECESCKIFTGGTEEQSLVHYRGHRICAWCVALWKEKDSLEGIEASWEKLTNPVRGRGIKEQT